MSEKLPIIDESLINASVAMQELQARYPELQLPVPRFVLAGEQSSGKTRMLSFFAAMKIGGAEKSECGTRCPVVYTFRSTNSQPTAATGRGNAQLQPCALEDVEKHISAHMEALKDAFSKETFHVEITGSHCLNAVIVDLPGIKPTETPEAHQSNITIGKMVHEATKPTNSILLLMTNFDGKLDVEYFEGSLNRILRYCYEPTSAASRAILFVSRLDAVHKEITMAKLDQHIRIAEGKGFLRKNMHFITLKPELLDPNENSELFEGGNGSFGDLSVYFQKTAFVKEKQFLTGSASGHPTVLTSKKIDDPSLNFGIEGAKRAIEKQLQEMTRANLSITRNLLEQEWNKMEREIALLLEGDEKGALERRINLYTRLAKACLEGAATHNSYVIERTFREVIRESRDNGDAALFKINDDGFPREMIESLQTTFSYEDLNVEKGLGAREFQKLLHSAARDLFEEKNALETPKAPGAAVSRLLRLFGFLLLERKLDDVSSDEIENFGEFTNKNASDMFPIDKIIGQIVQNANPSNLMFNFIINWCAWLYHRQTLRVCEYLRKWYLLDQAYPTLVDRLEQMVDEKYRTVLTGAAGRIADEASSVISHRMGELKIHETVSVLNLLCCSKLCTDMMQESKQEDEPKKDPTAASTKKAPPKPPPRSPPPKQAEENSDESDDEDETDNEASSSDEDSDASDEEQPRVKVQVSRPKKVVKLPVPQPAPGASSTGPSDLEKAKGLLDQPLEAMKTIRKQNALPPMVAAAINLLSTLLENPDGSPGRDVFKFLGAAEFNKVMAFVRMEGFNLRNIHRSDIEKHAGSINKTAQMIVHFNDGLIFMEFHRMVTNGLVTQAKHTFDTIQSSLEQATRELLADETRLDELLEDNKSAALRVETCRKSGQLLNTIDKLNVCFKKTLTTIPTEDKRKLFDRLQEIVNQTAPAPESHKSEEPEEDSSSENEFETEVA